MTSWAELDKLQGAKRADGSTAIVIRDDRAAAEITEARHLSILFAVSRVAYARTVLVERYDGKGTVVYMTAGMPPAFLIEAVCAAGGIVFDGARDHRLAKPTELTMLLDGAFCDFAIAVKRRFKVKSMRDALEVREIELRRRPIDPANVVAKWTAIYELMALAGEAAREKRPGRWILDAEQKVRFPLALDFGGGLKMFPGRLAEAIVGGTAGTLVDLLNSIDSASARGVSNVVDAARVMPLLHDRRTFPGEAQWELLVAEEVDTPDLPVIAYVEDMDASIAWNAPGPIPAAMRTRAITNIGNENVDIEIVDIESMKFAVVSGSFYSAETLLHRPSMKALEAKLGSEVLLVGLPARGYLLAASAAIADDALQAFLLLVEKYYLDNTERERITSEVLVYQGKPVGRVQSNFMDTRRALRRMGIDPDA